MRGGAIHNRTTFLILCNASTKRNGQRATTDTLPYTDTYIFRKAKINLHTTPKLTVVMPISCLLPCADPGIFVRGGVGSTSVEQKSSDNVVCLFFSFFLVFSLFYIVKWLISKKNIIFQVSGGGPNLSRGGGSNFFQGGGGRIAYSL